MTEPSRVDASFGVDSAAFVLVAAADRPADLDWVDWAGELLDRRRMVGLHLGADGVKAALISIAPDSVADIYADLLEPGEPIVFPLIVEQGPLLIGDPLQLTDADQPLSHDVPAGEYVACIYTFTDRGIDKTNALWLIQLTPISLHPGVSRLSEIPTWPDLPSEDDRGMSGGAPYPGYVVPEPALLAIDTSDALAQKLALLSIDREDLELARDAKDREDTLRFGKRVHAFYDDEQQASIGVDLPGRYETLAGKHCLGLTLFPKGYLETLTEAVAAQFSVDDFVPLARDPDDNIYGVARGDADGETFAITKGKVATLKRPFDNWFDEHVQSDFVRWLSEALEAITPTAARLLAWEEALDIALPEELRALAGLKSFSLVEVPQLLKGFQQLLVVASNKYNDRFLCIDRRQPRRVIEVGSARPTFGPLLRWLREQYWDENVFPPRRNNEKLLTALTPHAEELHGRDQETFDGTLLPKTYLALFQRPEVNRYAWPLEIVAPTQRQALQQTWAARSDAQPPAYFRPFAITDDALFGCLCWSAHVWKFDDKLRTTGKSFDEWLTDQVDIATRENRAPIEFEPSSAASNAPAAGPSALLAYLVERGLLELAPGTDIDRLADAFCDALENAKSVLELDDWFMERDEVEDVFFDGNQLSQLVRQIM